MNKAKPRAQTVATSLLGLTLAGLSPSWCWADTLADALSAAYAKNPALQAARANARAADETLVQARSSFLPRVSAFATYGPERVRTQILSSVPGAAPGSSVLDARPGDYGAQASQSLFEGGRRIGEVKQAGAVIGVAQESLRAVEQQVLLQVITAYMDVRRDSEVLAIRTNNVDVLAHQFEESKARFEVGEITKTDVAQSQARLAGARSQVSLAQAQLEASRARYAETVGIAPAALEDPPAPPAAPESLDAAIETGLSANPDYRRLEETAKAAKAQITIERAALLPNLSLVGRIDHQFEDRLRLGNIDTATATAQLSIPLYQGGFARSQLAQAHDQYERAAQDAAGARRQVVTAVTTAWNDLAAARQSIVSSKEQVDANQLAYEGTQQEHQVGLRTTIEVLNAEQELLDARVALVGAEHDAYVDANALLQAIGALSAKTLAVNGPLYDPDKHRRAVQWRY